MQLTRYSVILTIILIMGSICISPVFGDAVSTKTITDMGGKSVTIPADVQKIIITCYGGATQEVAVMGAKEKIIAQPPQKFATFLKMYPDLAQVPNVGSFDELNLESIMKLNPDVVINSVTAGKGNAKLEENSIPVIQVYTGKATLDNIYNEFRMVGDLLNKPDQAEKLISYWDKKKALLNERISAIPENERKSVYYMLGGPLHTNGEKWWGHSFVTIAGGINVADGIGDVRDINAEQLSKWDPDVIVVSANEGSYVTDEAITSNPQLAGLKAVKNGSVYHIPIGGFWWDRPSPESPLGFLWLAKTLYPDTFSDIDMASETREFFKEFYGYDLSDDEVKEILAAKAPAV